MIWHNEFDSVNNIITLTQQYICFIYILYKSMLLYVMQYWWNDILLHQQGCLNRCYDMRNWNKRAYDMLWYVLKFEQKLIHTEEFQTLKKKTYINMSRISMIRPWLLKKRYIATKDSFKYFIKYIAMSVS